MARITAALLLVCACAAARAADDVRLWHALDAGVAAQLGRLAAEYNAGQSEFRVRLLRFGSEPERLVRLSLPINTERPVLFYNRDAFRRARLDPAATPKTWYEMPGMLGALADAGQACGYTTAWPAWVLMENSGGAFSRQLMVRWTSMLATWEKSGLFSYSGRANEAEARFAAGECAILTSSSASRTELVKRAGFEVGVAPLPYYDDSGVASRALPAGAPVVWAERQTVGVTSFFAFLATRAAQARREREALEVQLEAVWRGDKTALDALNALGR